MTIRVMDDLEYDEYVESVLRPADYSRASYVGGLSDQMTHVTFDDMFREGGRALVTVPRSVMSSDEAIRGVLAHEAHEINALYHMPIESGKAPIEAIRWNRLMSEKTRSLHSQAWQVTNMLLWGLK